MKNVVIVLPTYNERDNIGKLLQIILYQQHSLPAMNLSVLVVDDTSPDGTAEIVKDYMAIYPEQVHLISGKKAGLGAAYVRGFKHAMRELHADIVFEMDADFSHDPNDIPRFVKAIIDNGADFVIGSRYIKGGSIPDDWSLLRKLNSKWGNILARRIAGIKGVNDTTSGFRAITTSLLKRINLNKLNVKGYAFQINILNQAIKKGALVHEVPIVFIDRKFGESKIRIKDITEFVFSTLAIRFHFLPDLLRFLLIATILVGATTGISYAVLILEVLSPSTLLIVVISVLLAIMTAQSLFTLFWMIYAWEDPKTIEKNKSPKFVANPRFSFTAIVPARQEENVIADTLKAIRNIQYPELLKETIVVCQRDDIKTIAKVEKTILELGADNMKLVVFYDQPVNKPHSLNRGLMQSTKDIVVIFDAEDEPHKDIYKVMNTVFIRDHVDVVQSGVQLMNYRSNWFSTLNVLEYFFWFKSALHLFTKIGSVTLGGNSIFIKRKWLINVNGWNENMLTEDADLGIRLSLAGARMRIIYDEEHTTREETPSTTSGFIKQRTRWNQGFLQVLLKGDWMSLPKTRQKLLAMYILGWPFMQAIIFCLLPFSILLGFTLELPIVLVLFMMLPIYLLLLQMVVYCIGLYEFTRDYKLKFPILLPLKVFVMYYPFQVILGISSIRAVLRILQRTYSWEKTLHINAHRGEAPAI